LNGSVSVQRLATGWTVWDSNYGREKIFSPLQKNPDQIWDTHNLIFNVYWGSFPGTWRWPRTSVSCWD